jgi:hypothetical protein
MLTRSKSKQGEGKLASYNLEIGSRSFNKRGKMASPRRLGPYNFEYYFFEAFNLMKAMVEEMYEDRKKAKGESTSVKTKEIKGEGEEPREPPSSPSSSSSSSSDGI